MARIGYTERVRLFGISGSRNAVLVTTPWNIRAQCHFRVRDLFNEACAEASFHTWNPGRIDSFAMRAIRAAASMSLHSWALAWDFFATGPGVVPPGGVWTPINGVPASFANCFTRRGFTWGATWTRKDVPHIEWAGGYPSISNHKPIVKPDGSTPSIQEATMALSAPIAGVKMTPSGNGYWQYGADGGVFTFGDAKFHGSLGSQRLTGPITGFDCTPDGNGYLMTGADGGVFAFGTAKFQGRAGA